MEQLSCPLKELAKQETRRSAAWSDELASRSAVLLELRSEQASLL